MAFELWHLFLAGVLYLALLFLIAYAAEREWIPRRLVRHPLTYTLSLGVYATSWSYYGSVGFADSQGYNFLTIYLGVTLAFLLAPVLLRPIMRLVNEYQLSSLADLFAFRYRSQLGGVLVTLFMLAGTLPYIALQIRAVVESLQVVAQRTAPDLIALVFCVTMILFAVLFGARHISAREKHEGLVVAIAFESLLKLGALLAVGLFALFGVFGGTDGLNGWLQSHPEAVEALYRPVREGPWSTLLLLAFAAAFLLPRQFHMTFTESMEPRALKTAYWAFPLFLLLLNLPIPAILWAGQALVPGMSPDYYVLGITLHSGTPILPVLTFLGGLSAASAMIIVTSLALGAMAMNHIVLPASFPPKLTPETNIYRWLLWGRRTMIALVIAAGYGFYLLLEQNQGLVQLGLISFVAAAQFLPGIVGLLFWRQATRTGFLAGLIAGITVWAFTLLLPLLQRSGVLELGFDPLELLGVDAGSPWVTSTFWSLSINGVLFTLGSLATRPSTAEQEAARACCKETFAPPEGVLVAESPEQMREHLARIIGSTMANHEVDRALSDLSMSAAESRPTRLRELRDRIERNLSGLVGPVLARLIVNERLQMDPQARTALADSVRFVEQRLEDSQTRLQGLAAELDALRRYHRQVLQDLPLGVCSLGPGQEIVSWNFAIVALSGVDEHTAVGQPLNRLPEPWSGLLLGFLNGEDQHLRKVRVRVEGNTRMLNLHKAAVEDPGGYRTGGGMVILVEDLTELYTLEAELAHSERLASVGRLAAGVAHEIGNPVTGIASLAQNLLFEEDAGLQEESLHQILHQTRRISNIVHSLVSFSHSGTAMDHTPSRVRLRECIEEAVRLVRLSHSAKKMRFENGCDEQVVIFGDHQRLVQVFVNLLSNACDASSPADRVVIDCRRAGDHVHLEIRDHGAGMPAEVQDRVFEPFYTTKQPGEGTGLGLPMVYNIVQEHSGNVYIHSTPGEGTCVVIKLPATLDEIEKSRVYTNTSTLVDPL